MDAPVFRPPPAGSLGPTNFPAVERARGWYRHELAAGHAEARDSTGTTRWSLTGPDATAVEQAVAGALQYAHDTGRLQPITNRHAGGVIDMLTNGSALRTGSPRSLPHEEHRAGIRDAGEENIPVNYALLHVRPEVELAETLEKIPNLGQVSYGPVALVLKPDVLRRSTLTEADSVDVDRAYPPEGVVDATTAALGRRASGWEPQMAHNVGRSAQPHLLRMLGSGVTPEAMSVALAQAPLTVFSARGLPPVPEVQVYGGIRPRDVASIRIGSDAPQAAVDAIRGAARRWNIPVESVAVSSPQAREGWIREMQRAGVEISKEAAARATHDTSFWAQVVDRWVQPKSTSA